VTASACAVFSMAGWRGHSVAAGWTVDCYCVLGILLLTCLLETQNMAFSLLFLLPSLCISATSTQAWQQPLCGLFLSHGRLCSSSNMSLEEGRFLLLVCRYLPFSYSFLLACFPATIHALIMCILPYFLAPLCSMARMRTGVSPPPHRRRWPWRQTCHAAILAACAKACRHARGAGITLYCAAPFAAVCYAFFTYSLCSLPVEG